MSLINKQLHPRGSKPSGRACARALGVSHTWVQKLVRKFRADPTEMWRLQRANGELIPLRKRSNSEPINIPGRTGTIFRWAR